MTGWYKLAWVRDRLGNREGGAAARREARDAHRLLPAFQRRRQLGWYQRLRLGLPVRV